MDLELLSLEEFGVSADAIALINEDLQPLVDAVANEAALGENPNHDEIAALTKAAQDFFRQHDLIAGIISVGKSINQILSACPFIDQGAIVEGLWRSIVAANRKYLPHDDDPVGRIDMFLHDAAHLKGSQFFDYLEAIGGHKLFTYGHDGEKVFSSRLIRCDTMLRGIVLQQTTLRLAEGIENQRRAEAGREIIAFLATHPCLGIMTNQHNRRPTIVFASR